MSPLPILTAPYRESEPVGVQQLLELAAEVYPDGDPLGLPAAEAPLHLERLGEQLVVVLRLPLVARGELDVAVHGNELIITLGSYRRVLALPSALQRHRIVGAGLANGELRVRFLPREGNR
jgi:arsenite-transporting ATPase